MPTAETMSDVVPTLRELGNELHSVTDWEVLAVQLGLEWHEVEIIKKDEQVGTQTSYNACTYHAIKRLSHQTNRPSSIFDQDLLHMQQVENAKK